MSKYLRNGILVSDENTGGSTPPTPTNTFSEDAKNTTFSELGDKTIIETLTTPPVNTFADDARNTKFVELGNNSVVDVFNLTNEQLNTIDTAMFQYSTEITELKSKSILEDVYVIDAEFDVDSIVIPQLNQKIKKFTDGTELIVYLKVISGDLKRIVLSGVMYNNYVRLIFNDMSGSAPS